MIPRNFALDKLRSISVVGRPGEPSCCGGRNGVKGCEERKKASKDYKGGNHLVKTVKDIA